MGYSSLEGTMRREARLAQPWRLVQERTVFTSMLDSQLTGG
jgi:hypothetical protein